MTPLNERIARLLEPLESVTTWEKGLSADLRGELLFSPQGRWIRDRNYELKPNLPPGYFEYNSSWGEPMTSTKFDESIDASMRVIEKRLPKAIVTLSPCGYARIEWPSELGVKLSIDTAETTAEALALALCAALEAEVGK